MKKIIGFILCISFLSTNAMENTKGKKKPKRSSFRRRRRKFPEHKTQSTPIRAHTQPFSIKKVLESNPFVLSPLMLGSTLYLRNQGLVSLEGLGEIPGIEKIEHLKLENNKLSNIDPDHFKGPNLHSLDLSNNQIEELPDNFFDNLSLKVLNLTGNPLLEEQKAKIRKQCIGSVILVL